MVPSVDAVEAMASLVLRLEFSIRKFKIILEEFCIKKNW